MPGTIVYGKTLVCDADTEIPSGALYVEGDTIREVGTWGELSARHPRTRRVGDAEFLVVPGFVNAHSHGKGLTDFQRGTPDDTLETWRLRRFPPVEVGPDTRWNALRLLESGVTTTMHNPNLVRPGAWAEEYEAILAAYAEAGLRVALAPSLADRNPFVYGDNEAFLRSLPADLEALGREALARSAAFGPAEYFRAMEELQARRSQRVAVLHGPSAPQWVSDEALAEIGRRSARDGTRVHLHLLQTPLQMLYGWKAHGRSLVDHLADLGLLGPALTCGHCVWVSREDIGRLAAAGASVTHHPACNLRVRNGIAPVAALRAAGVTVAVGMDEKELGDDRDYLEELRLAARLHRVDSFRPDAPCLSAAELFRMGTEAGAQVLGFGGLCGALRPGLKADMALLRTDRLTEPFTFPGHRAVDLLLARGRARDVDTVLVGGEVLLRGGAPVRLDREEVKRRLAESLPADYAARYAALNEPVARLRRAVAAWFEPWVRELERMDLRPFYPLNGALP